jgi:hypothetical protein
MSPPDLEFSRYPAVRFVSFKRPAVLENAEIDSLAVAAE